ncbi:hypothetical protein [Sphingobacterium thalpophilum]|uniref:hypothetical protein n=1 Tax=Sphingobacterium thalpophilum TaxID=259 RepID=UPI0024A6B63C|nr:hypothetical protein [Sphingobacterium thalpophilum]
MLEEILHIRNVRHAVKRVISNGAPEELMDCRQINFVTTLTRIGNPCRRIFSLALAPTNRSESRDSQSKWRQGYLGHPNGHRPCYEQHHWLHRIHAEAEGKP